MRWFYGVCVCFHGRKIEVTVTGSPFESEYGSGPTWLQEVETDGSTIIPLVFTLVPESRNTSFRLLLGGVWGGVTP